MSLTEIYDPRSGVFLRNGWHALEAAAGESFRWSRNHAKILIARFEPGSFQLRFEIEPGPGVAELPCRFAVTDGFGKARYDVALAGRLVVSLGLENALPLVHELQLTVEGGGHISGLDYRALDFRVFGIRVQPVADVLSANAHAKLGSGWYPLETFDDESFRWVDNDARVTIDAGLEGTVDFDIERGPSADRESFELTVYDEADHIITRSTADSRERIRIAARRARGHELRLHAEGSNGRPTADGRMLNFRVFVDRHE